MGELTGEKAGTATNLHATTIVLGERGVLIRGASGAGKTALALALVEQAERAGGFARLVADDRTLVTRHGGEGADGRLVARPHPAVAGLVERRGYGIVAVPHEPACVLSLVVDILAPGFGPGLGPGLGKPAARPERHPAPDALRCTIEGVDLPRVAVAGPPGLDALALVDAALAAAPSPIPPIPSMPVSSDIAP